MADTRSTCCSYYLPLVWKRFKKKEFSSILIVVAWYGVVRVIKRWHFYKSVLFTIKDQCRSIVSKYKNKEKSK